MGDIVRWGIVGPGGIATSVMPDFQHVEGATVLGVASRSKQRAENFATTYGIERAYGSYEQIIADPDIDVLYIATPHPQHYGIALAALKAGKALLVEKSFTATTDGAREVIDLARSTGKFVMEAMWTRFQPAVVRVRDLIAQGAIGQPRTVFADLGVDRPYDPASRLFAPELGGGAMLDLGVYVVSFAQMILGTPTSVQATGTLVPTGVDGEAEVWLKYDDGRSANLLMSLLKPSPGQARIIGQGGSYIDVLPRFHHPSTIVLNRRGAEPETITLPPIGVGYAHELIEVTSGVREGRTESRFMPLDDTLAVQAILGDACAQLGVHHAEDPTSY